MDKLRSTMAFQRDIKNNPLNADSVTEGLSTDCQDRTTESYKAKGEVSTS